jgi:hypothetical protein
MLSIGLLRSAALECLCGEEMRGEELSKAGAETTTEASRSEHGLGGAREAETGRKEEIKNCRTNIKRTTHTQTTVSTENTRTEQQGDAEGKGEKKIRVSVQILDK